jgi:uracil-DNA glycosylase
MTKARIFVDQLASLKFDNVFNPYADACPEHDRENSPEIRRNNLSVVIEAALAIGVQSMWFGRDLGYRGGRRTGLALTDEAHLHALRLTFRNAPVQQATATAPVAERTAQEIWKMVRLLPDPPFLWNVFPFHPHEPNDPMSNRCHTAREARLCEDILCTLLTWFKPTRVVALGKDAHKALNRLGFDNTCIRHPSYGGQAEFISGIRELYDLPAARPARLF